VHYGPTVTDGHRHANPDTVTDMTPPRQQSGMLFKPADWMGGREAQAALGFGSRLAVYERALRGEIATIWHDGRRLFARDDVAKLAQTLGAAA
jgi:hypothetical protein